MTFRELCAKEIVQLQDGVCLGRADDLVLEPATARVQSLLLLGRPRLFGLMGRDETLTIPWEQIETVGQDTILVRTQLTPPPQTPPTQGLWGRLCHWLGLRTGK